ncbi:P-loop containing nucleoside triphosphate hydrolase protein [Melampsora americana]|nr:P-loop containing nucleoside triphosphate hydrolase protein [Melampsora americana]
MASSSISVAVRVRPPTEREKNLIVLPQSTSSSIFGDSSLSSTLTTSSNVASHRSLRSIIKVLDQRVLIFDPPESNPFQQAQRQILARLGGGKKVKDMRFCFDRVFDDRATQEDVYEGSAKELVQGVLDGFNATVFAYGATGCGKTHTITGTPEAPGIVYLLMKDLFGRIASEADDMTVEISISYLEIYNETIRDLLNPNAPILNLREANSSVSVPGLTTSTPESASDVIRLISTGNAHRTVHGTEANAVSSRSHAVLSVDVRRKPRTASLSDSWSVATLSVIDLAGSERASVTKNKGDRLLEGANINKSLLALGNCINALCDPKGRGGHVPYRNSKLTRLLKHSLGGNCRTLMIVCVAPTSAHYDETHNALQYANRAKEIKTKATRNIISVDRHVSQYVQVIFQLRQELEDRKREDKTREDRVKQEAIQNRVKIDEAIDKAYKHWEDYIEKAQAASRAIGQLEAIIRLTNIWNQWKESVIRSGDEDSSWIGHEVDALNTKLTNERLKAAKMAEDGKFKKSMYEACVTSLARTVEQQSGQQGKNLFDRAVVKWENKMNKIILDGASREGESDVVGRMGLEISTWFLNLKSKLTERQGSEELHTRVNQAINVALSSLLSPSSSATPSVVATSNPSTSTGTSLSFTSGPSHTDLQQLKSTLVKPSTFHPSPSSSSENSRTSMIRQPKARRQSGLGGSPSKLATTYFSKKASPRKQVVFPNRATNGILKSRASAITNKSSSIEMPPPALPKPAAAGVRWRDEESDGRQLESFQEMTMSTETSSSTDQSMLLNQSPLKGLTSLQSSIFSQPSVLPLPNNTSSGSTSEPSSSSTTAPSSSSRSSHLKQGYLSRRQTRSGTRFLDSLGEEDESAAETSSSQAVSSSMKVFRDQSNLPKFEDLGFKKPINQKPRRESSIGPIRNNGGGTRRQSMTFYQRKAGRDSLAGTRLTSSNPSTSSISPTKRIAGRRLSMLPVPSASSSSSSSLFKSHTPAWR